MKKIFLLSIVIMAMSAFCGISLYAEIIKVLPNFLIKANLGAGTKISLAKNQTSNSYFIGNADYSSFYNTHGRITLALDPFFISNNERIKKFELRITPQAKVSCLYNFVHNDFEISAGAYAACIEARGVYNVKDNDFNFIIAVKPEMNVYFSDCFGLDIAPFLEFSILEKEMYIGAELGVVFNPTRKKRNNFIHNYVNGQTSAFDNNNGQNELWITTKQADILKRKPLQVTETEWGFEISNVDVKGKRICKEKVLYIDNLDCVCIVFKSNDEVFDFEKFASKYVEDEANAYTIENGNFIPVVVTTYSLESIDNVLVVSTKGKFSVCEANSTKDKSLYLKLSNYSELTSSNVYKLIEKPIEEKRRIEAEEKTRAEIELKHEREKKLKKYGFNSIEEWNAWKIRCSPTNLYRSLTIGAESSFIVGDITYIKEYTLSIRHLDVISGGYSYLISFPGLSKCCNVISMHQLSYMGGYDNLVSESMLLRFVGKGQYRQGYSIVDCDTFALVEEGTPDYNNFDKLMREIDF